MPPPDYLDRCRNTSISFEYFRCIIFVDVLMLTDICYVLIFVRNHYSVFIDYPNHDWTCFILSILLLIFNIIDIKRKHENNRGNGNHSRLILFNYILIQLQKTYKDPIQVSMRALSLIRVSKKL